MSENESKFTVTKVNDTTVVQLTEESITDPLYIIELSDELASTLKNADPPDMLIDFTKVEFLSSTMLGTLTRLFRQTHEQEGRIRLCGIRPSVLEVFRITKLDTIFDIQPDAQSALASG
jgi:anti-sigma B factor antagonist